MATTYVWNNTGTAWETAADWTPNSPPGGPTATDIASFDPTLPAASIMQPVIGAADNALSLNLANNFFGGTYAFTGTGNTLTLGGTSTTGITTHGYGNQAINGPTITGASSSSTKLVTLNLYTDSGLTLAGATTISANEGITYLYGGTLTIDDTGTNQANRLISTGTIAINGGAISVLGNSSSSMVSLPNYYTNTTYGSEGVQTISVTDNGGASTTAKFANTSAPNLNVVTGESFNFVGVNGVLGTGPKITFTGGVVTDNTIGTGMLAGAASATSGSVGWAIATDSNGVGWATYGSGGISVLAPTQTAANAADLANLTQADAADFTPAANATVTVASVPNGTSTGQATPTTGLDAVITGSLRIAPAGAGAVLDLATNNADLATQGIMLTGPYDFAISGTSSSVLGGSATKFIYVTNPSTTLNIGAVLSGSSDGLGGTGQTSSTNPVSICGPGFVNLTGNFYQIGVSTNKRLNLLGGTLRGNAIELGGFGAVGTADAIAFRGGVLEITGGMDGTGSSADFMRTVNNTTTTGEVNWASSSNNDTQGGSGGFSAYGNNASVNLGGAATPTGLTWGVGSSGFVQDGFALIFGSTQSNARLDFLNPIALDGGTAGLYDSREIKVIGGTGGDSTNMAGVISGSSSTDLIKSGTGTLTLSAANTYSGNTFIEGGTLLANAAAVTGTSSSTGKGAYVHVVSGTLGGTGGVNGAVIVNPSGNIAPGLGAAGASSTLHTGALTVNGTATFVLDTTAATADKVASSGAVTLGPSATLTLVDLTGVPSGGVNNLVLITSANSVTSDVFSNFPNDTPITIGANIYTVSNDTVPDEITVSVTPEPCSFSLLALAGVGLLKRRRRRAWVSKA